MKARALAILILVAALVAGASWLLRSDGDLAADGASAVRGDQAEAPAGLGAQALVPAGAEQVGGERVEIAPATAPAITRGAAIVGQVVDVAGQPIAGARVQCTPTAAFDAVDFDPGDWDNEKWRARMRAQLAQRVATRTGSDGRFVIVPGPEGANLELRVLAPAFLVLSQSVRRPKDSDYDAGMLRLQAGAIVTGRVLDRAGRPVAGAAVQRDDTPAGGPEFDFDSGATESWAEARGSEATARTDAQGNFALNHLVPGEFALSARHADHPTARRRSLVVAPGATLPDVVLTLEPGLTIRGKATDVPAGVQGLRALAARPREATAERALFAGMGFGPDGEAAERSAAVGADGTFTLRGLAADATYRVWLAQRGRGFAGQSACSQRVELRAGAAGVELRYESGVAVTFQVVDARNGQAIERLWVTDRLQGGGGLGDFFASAQARARDYPEGRVTIANLRPKKKQTLTLSVEATGYAKFAREGIELPLRGANDLGTVRLEPVPVVRVRVTAASDDQPVAGALVRLADKRVGRDGAGRPFPPPGFGPPGGAGGGPRSGRTDASGRCTLNALPGSEVFVSVHSDEFAPYTSPVLVLPASEDAEHAARLCRGGTVAVEVVDAEGKPVAAASVLRQEMAPAPGAPAGASASGATDAQGRTAFERLAPGEHRFRLAEGGAGEAELEAVLQQMQMRTGQAPGPNHEWQTVTVVEGSRTTLRLHKPRSASVSGIVRENGRPLPDAQIEVVRAGDEALRAWRRNSQARTKTDAGGQYRVDGVRPGAHKLRIAHATRATPALVPVTLAGGENVADVDLDVAIVRGVVRAGDDQPIAGASVLLGGDRGGAGPRNEPAAGGPDSSAEQRVVTDGEGRYELRGVPSGTKVFVRAQAKGFASAESAPIEVARGGVTEGVDVRLSVAGSVRVRATSDSPFMTVQATYEGPGPGVQPVLSVLRGDSVVLEGLRPGPWKIRLVVPGRTDNQGRSVEVRPGTIHDVSF